VEHTTDNLRVAQGIIWLFVRRPCVCQHSLTLQIPQQTDCFPDTRCLGTRDLTPVFKHPPFTFIHSFPKTSYYEVKVSRASASIPQQTVAHRRDPIHLYEFALHCTPASRMFRYYFEWRLTSSQGPQAGRTLATELLLPGMTMQAVLPPTITTSAKLVKTT
jgi:hypothetical protein